ncbi:MAG: nucleotide exchange factor GrpE [Alphaproteobacteria bacterium]
MTSQDRPDHEPQQQDKPGDADPRAERPSANDAGPATEPGEAAAAYARAQAGADFAAGAHAGGPDSPPTPGEAGADAALAALRAENEELRGQMLRTLADMENLRRRTAREKEDSAKYAISRFAKDLLSVGDNLQRALQAIPADALAGNELMRTLADGVAAVERELAAALDRNGVRAIEAQGAPFDSNLHEAVMEQPTAEVPPGHVAQVFQTGYLISDRLLRPAMVAVAKAVPGQAPAAAPEG